MFSPALIHARRATFYGRRVVNSVNALKFSPYGRLAVSKEPVDLDTDRERRFANALPTLPHSSYSTPVIQTTHFESFAQAPCILARIERAFSGRTFHLTEYYHEKIKYIIKLGSNAFLSFYSKSFK